MSSVTLTGLFAQAVAKDPARPLITYYDRRTGERTELSGTTLSNWVSKTANFMRDDLMLEAGGTVAIALPPHWQTTAIILAAWELGCGVVEPSLSEPVDALFCAQPRLMELADAAANEIVVSSLHPMGLGVQAKPDHVIDYTTEVRNHGDHFAAYTQIDPTLLAVTAGSLSLTHQSAAQAAQQIAAQVAIRDDDRILMIAESVADAGPLTWLAAPLAAGASIVLVSADDDPELSGWLTSIAAQENVTASLGVQLTDSPGIRHLGDSGQPE
ncbi:uncharacterized protein (TIGR03089 family) [Antricoccus suffuscus]|uniref:Uncharacterized protein (TIGR03089 family) n=1 Tax=Antricoccus suffuscus TaxID=1629062 RepID=A0A2T0ZQQ2_9ACTN|nr:TIGR03089 family protein [Antricoccus suffuscus]PRZ38614.1 uncharacterized protein (TIGR03089 family) [Antricoccus suffuscus]